MKVAYTSSRQIVGAVTSSSLTCISALLYKPSLHSDRKVSILLHSAERGRARSTQTSRVQNDAKFDEKIRKMFQ
jgi:hypothetical protein